jgi:(2Fe-2S) ferredoxin
MNRCQDEPMIRFRTDGSGEGIVWEWHGPVKAKSLVEKAPETEAPVTTSAVQSFVAAIQP